MSDSENNNAIREEEALLVEDTPPPENPADTDQSTGTDIAATFSLFKSYLDKQLSSLKDDLKEETLLSTDSVAKKIKERAEVSFKYEGNKRQHIFNVDMIEHVENAKQALKRKRYKQAEDSLEELTKGLNKRNKLIRLADKSPAGWDLVNEYLSDELASGSEDEKRIKRAEQAALRKRNQTRLRNKPSRGSRPSSNTSVPASHSTSFSAGFNPRPSTSQSNWFPHSAHKKASPGDICFGCGLQGHWRADCRKAKANQGTSGSHSSSWGGN